MLNQSMTTRRSQNEKGVTEMEYGDARPLIVLQQQTTQWYEVQYGISNFL